MSLFDSNMILPAVPAASIWSFVSAAPWFFAFNHWLLAGLVRLFPLTDPRMNLAQFFMNNRLVSGFVFAAACYYFWSLRDERTEWRRARIIESIAACVAAVLFSLALRPFVGALPPCQTPEFQG